MVKETSLYFKIGHKFREVVSYFKIGQPFRVSLSYCMKW